MLFTCYKMTYGVLPFHYINIHTLTLLTLFDSADWSPWQGSAGNGFCFYKVELPAVLLYWLCWIFTWLWIPFPLCKFVSSIFFIIREFALQIWCCSPLRWIESCGRKCTEAITLLWQQRHWHDKSSRSYVFSWLQEGIYPFSPLTSTGVSTSSCYYMFLWICLQLYARLLLWFNYMIAY
jgi:hypothetical protein